MYPVFAIVTCCFKNTYLPSPPLGLWEITWEEESRGPLIGIWHTGKEQSNKRGEEAYLRILLPLLPSGANIAKIKPATGNIYASTSRTVGDPRPRAQRS